MLGVLWVRCPWPLGAGSPLCALRALCVRCPWPLGACPAVRVPGVRCVRCPWHVGACSPVRAAHVLCVPCPWGRGACSPSCVLGALCVRRPWPLGACSPVCMPYALCGVVWCVALFVAVVPPCAQRARRGPYALFALCVRCRCVCVCVCVCLLARPGVLAGSGGPASLVRLTILVAVVVFFRPTPGCLCPFFLFLFLFFFVFAPPGLCRSVVSGYRPRLFVVAPPPSLAPPLSLVFGGSRPWCPGPWRRLLGLLFPPVGCGLAWLRAVG